MKVPVRMSVNTVPFAMPTASYFVSLHPSFCITPRCLKGSFRVLGHAGLEAVLEAAGDILEVPHAAGADGLSALGLLAPVVCKSPDKSVHQPFHYIGNEPDSWKVFALSVTIHLLKCAGLRTLSGLSSGITA